MNGATARGSLQRKLNRLMWFQLRGEFYIGAVAPLKILKLFEIHAGFQVNRRS